MLFCCINVLLFSISRAYSSSLPYLEGRKGGQANVCSLTLGVPVIGRSKGRRRVTYLDAKLGVLGSDSSSVSTAKQNIEP